jgi:hypothetical protein
MSFSEKCAAQACTAAGDAGCGFCSIHLDRFRAKMAARLKAEAEPTSPMRSSLGGMPPVKKGKPSKSRFYHRKFQRCAKTESGNHRFDRFGVCELCRFTHPGSAELRGHIEHPAFAPAKAAEYTPWRYENEIGEQELAAQYGGAQ